MGRSLCLVSLVLSVAVAHAALTPQDYWKTKLPNAPMPSAIRDLFRPGVGAGTVDAPATPAAPPRLIIFNIYRIAYAAESTLTQVDSLPDEATFFLEKDLLPGKKMRLDFTRTAPAAPFIPHGEANAIPFSTEKLPAVLSRFSVLPNSSAADGMRTTLRQCKAEIDAAETSKYCATSLEAMVDFALSTLGTHHFTAVSSEFCKDGLPKQVFAVASSSTRGEKTAAGRDVVACHPMPWPYAVFYCHVSPETRARVVALVGEDGASVDAVAVCHSDTSAWSPRHLAFQMTKVKPGTVPICHFLPQGGVVWALRR